MTNNRRHTRYKLDSEIEVVTGAETLAGRSENISQGGIFISVDPAPAFGDKLTLRLDLPGVRNTCEIPCIVRWSKAGQGVGLQFEQLRAIEVWALNKLLKSLEPV